MSCALHHGPTRSSAAEGQQFGDRYARCNRTRLLAVRCRRPISGRLRPGASVMRQRPPRGRKRHRRAGAQWTGQTGARTQNPPPPNCRPTDAFESAGWHQVQATGETSLDILRERVASPFFDETSKLDQSLGLLILISWISMAVRPREATPGCWPIWEPPCDRSASSAHAPAGWWPLA
jgi:hypothetical protein